MYSNVVLLTYFTHRSQDDEAIQTEIDQPGPAKIRKITSITAAHDISDIDHRSDDTVKYKILTDTQNFPRNFRFPQQPCGTKAGGKPHMHSFLLNWLDEYQVDGLVYSVKEDAAYCKYCRLFPGGERGLLVETPFCKWKDAIREFNAHFWATQKDKTRGCHGHKLHTSAMVRATEFIRQIEGKTQAINQVLDAKSHLQVLKNREVVKSIAKTVHFLAKQNLSLRSHRDDSQYYDVKGVNPGNFQELLKFQVEAGDTSLKLHFEEGQKNATYQSKTVQNELIHIMGDQILEGIIANVKMAKYFAVLADEATDRSLQSQLTVLFAMLINMVIWIH